MIRRAVVVFGLIVAVLGVGVQAAQATWSVVAVDPETGEVGVAVASCVGFEVSVIPVLVPGVGAAASQAAISEPSGMRIVEALSGGASAAETLDAVVAADDAPGDRQFGVVVLDDGGAGWTGSDTFDVALDRRSTDGTASVQGNILVSEAVVASALAAFEASDGDLPDRLLAALLAGADEGGDSRCGEQTATSAALIVARPGDQSYSFTDAGVLGVDPTDSVVPSVFVSVLVVAGAERAPDRLAEVWASADQDAATVAIREIDEGADTTLESARNVVLVLLGGVVALVVIVVFVVIRSKRRKQST
ncbi:MAG: hypothetical protein BMS9Abin20_1485 [Acidimicrobiia bacterium]|nr:MAG: hypothetical protein BMS9Abin20_1485 [Acidimicrobiia bacterium]